METTGFKCHLCDKICKSELGLKQHLVSCSVKHQEKEQEKTILDEAKENTENYQEPIKPKPIDLRAENVKANTYQSKAEIAKEIVLFVSKMRGMPMDAYARGLCVDMYNRYNEGDFRKDCKNCQFEQLWGALKAIADRFK